MPRTNKIDIYLEYLLAFIIIEFGWFNILLNIYRPELYIFIFVVILHYRKHKRIIVDKTIIIIGIIYIVLAIIQGVIWSFSMLSLITSFSFGILIPYFVYKTYGYNFLFIVAKVLSVLIYISFSIWLLHQFVPGFENIILTLINKANALNNNHLVRSMFVYTYWSDIGHFYGFSRNAGFVNEPASYSVYIIFVIVINYIQNIPLLSKRNIIYFLALFSTLSTTGYLAFAVIALLLLAQRRYWMLGLLSFLIFMFFSIFYLRNLDFMQEKIEQQYSEQTELALTEPTSGRFLGARKSFYVLMKYPLHGRGLLTISKPESINDPEYAGYGWYSYISRFGLVLGIMFMFIYFKGIFQFSSLGRISLFEQAVIVMAFFILFSAQSSIDSPIFMIFFFCGLYFNKKQMHYIQIQ